MKMYKLSFYVIEEALEQVKIAIFAAGAGAYDGFKNCCWQTRGEGQYQPVTEELKQQVEYKVEVYCPTNHMPEIITALKQAHPCAEPAFDVTEIVSLF